MTKGRFLAGVAVLALLAALDAVLKALAMAHAGPANSSGIPFLFAFALHKNPGIAFDIPLPLAVILPLTLIIGVIFGTYFGASAIRSHQYLEALACASICIGALGNFIDRAVNGFTTDYLILFRTSAINLSDLMILAGMIAFLWYHKGIPSSERPKTI